MGGLQIGHSKVMPPNTRAPEVIHTYLLHMNEKLAARMRRHDMVAQSFAIGLRSQDGWIGGRARSVTALGKTNGKLPPRSTAPCL